MSTIDGQSQFVGEMPDFKIDRAPDESPFDAVHRRSLARMAMQQQLTSETEAVEISKLEETS